MNTLSGMSKPTNLRPHNYISDLMKNICGKGLRFEGFVSLRD